MFLPVSVLGSCVHPDRALAVEVGRRYPDLHLDRSGVRRHQWRDQFQLLDSVAADLVARMQNEVEQAAGGGLVAQPGTPGSTESAGNQDGSVVGEFYCPLQDGVVRCVSCRRDTQPVGGVLERVRRKIDN
ncbi:hypothetical protein G352_21116, partial [Rhodococcus ruber BKS 20-38]